MYKTHIFIVSCLFFYSCANITMLTGGEKDSKPPVMVKSTPTHKSTNFSGNEISLIFDEFVDLDQPQKNIMVSPYTNQILDYYIVGKKVFIHFPEGLKQNTTYSIQINGAIKDFTEGNKLPNTELLFSTGRNIDSGKYNIYAEEQKTRLNGDNTLICLVKNKSDFFGKNYSFISKTAQGSTSFNNLNKENYYVYAFIDSNSNLKWDKTEPIGFSSKPILTGSSEILKLKMFHSALPKTDVMVEAKSKNEFDLAFNQEVQDLKSIDTNFVLIRLTDKNYKLIGKNVLENQKLRLNFNKDQYDEIELKPKKDRIYISQIITENARLGFIHRNDTIALPFNSYIQYLDLSKMKLISGSDTLKPNIYFIKNQIFITGLDIEKNYSLRMDSMAIRYMESYNKPILYNFSTYSKAAIFDSLTVTIDKEILSNTKTHLFIFQKNKWERIEKSPVFKLKNWYGSEVKFKITTDLNNDGIWNTGNIEKEIQPEPYYIETIKLDTKSKEYNLKIINP